MTDAVSTAPTPTAAPASVSLGAKLDAEIAVVHARLAVLEADAKTDYAKVKAWLGANWPHFVTWAAGAAAAVKLGVFKIL